VLLCVFTYTSADLDLNALDQIATAFIHLLDPAIQELSSPCLPPAWQDYVCIPCRLIRPCPRWLILAGQPYALALSLFSIFAIFFVELIAFRWGTAKLTALNMGHGEEPYKCNASLFAHFILKIDAHGHDVGSVAAHGPEGNSQRGPDQTNGDASYEKKNMVDVESLQVVRKMDENAAAQIIGVMILEFGVVLHRYDNTTELLSLYC